MRPPFYTAEQASDHGVRTVRLADISRGIEVSVAPSMGNRAWEMRVRGENILYFPFENPAAAKGNSHLNGIPFLAPWANRMPEGFQANGRRYHFNPDSVWLRRDPNGIPIHGLLTASPFWEVIEAEADASSAWATSRLEFWKYPDLLANWPFAHEYEMTYRLAGGSLEVSVAVFNRSHDPMPLAVGFHPYLQLPGVDIGDATVHLPVQRHVETDECLLATGETTPVSLPDRISLKERRFDDGFTGLVRGPDHRAVFSVEGGGKKIEVAFGPGYPVAIVYAPPGQNFICFEPMTAITNGVNLASEGKYAELQTVPAGGRRQESFWITP